MKYVMISFHKTDKKEWCVYGHTAPGRNENIGVYKSKNQAIDKAFEFGLPVFSGSTNYEFPLRRLYLLREL